MPSPDVGDDFVRISFPDEGARLVIMLFDEAVDGGLKIYDGVEDAVFQAPAGQLGKETLDSTPP